MNKYITIDTETGGIGDEVDLLTAFFGVLDEDLNLTAELTLLLRPDSENDIFKVSAKALEINGINLVEHFKNAETKSTAGQKLFNFLKEHTTNSEGKVTRLIPVGHNVAFDVRKVALNVLQKKTLDAFIGYRVLDTGTIGQFLQAAGIIPMEISASLESLMKHYKLQFEGKAHNERADALATVAVLKEMLKEVRK